MPQLPEFDDWKRPWNPGELDEEKIARLVYNARKGEQDAKEKVAAHEATIAQLNSDLDAEKARKSEADPEVQEQLKALLKENRELKAKGDAPRPQDQLAIDKLDVALELGLTKSQSARLVGATRDELLADGIVRQIVPEDPPAHEDPRGFCRRLAAACAYELRRQAG